MHHKKNRFTGLMALFFLLFAACAAQREGVTPLMIAGKEGKLAEAKKLIGGGAKIDEKSRYGWTALMFAANNGNSEVALALLDAGADPNVISGAIPSAPFATRGGYPKTTALREAIEEEHLDLARLLIKRGAKIDETAVAYAGRVGDVAFLQEIKRKGGSLKSVSKNPYDTSGFLETARHGKVAALRWFVENGEDVNQIQNAGTALSQAAYGDEREAVRYLLSVGAKPDLKYNILGGQSDETALYTAVSKHTEDPRFEANYAVVKMLLDRGANPKLRVWNGKTSPLDRAKKRYQNSVQHLSTIKDEVVRQRVNKHVDHEARLLRLLEKY